MCVRVSCRLCPVPSQFVSVPGWQPVLPSCKEGLVFPVQVTFGTKSKLLDKPRRPAPSLFRGGNRGNQG